MDDTMESLEEDGVEEEADAEVKQKKIVKRQFIRQWERWESTWPLHSAKTRGKTLVYPFFLFSC